MSFHNLRHTYACIRIAEGRDATRLAEEMGHASPSIHDGRVREQAVPPGARERHPGGAAGVDPGARTSRERHDSHMRVVETQPDGVVVELTRDELMILSNAVNEICHGPEAIEGWEFHTRVGATRAEAKHLLDALGEIR